MCRTLWEPLNLHLKIGVGTKAIQLNHVTCNVFIRPNTNDKFLPCLTMIN